MDKGIDSNVGSLKNVFVYSQARFDSFSLLSVPLTFGLKKLRADKRIPRGRGTVRDVPGGSRGGGGGWYSQPGLCNQLFFVRGEAWCDG